MTIWEAVILGFLQGATEFLPVSSSGHLVVGQALLDIDIPGIGFEIAVHLATLLSVVVAYRSELTDLTGRALRGDKDAWRYWGLVALASVPVGVIGVLYKDTIESVFDEPRIAAGCFLFTAAVLLSTHWALKRDPVDEMKPRSALLMGLLQVIALLPGVSRSGMTVTTGLWAGVDPAKAAQFSFFMLLPAVGGAALLAVPDLMAEGSGVPTGALIAGFISAAVTGVLAIRIFVAMLRNRSFPWFAAYLVVLGVGFGLWLGAS